MKDKVRLLETISGGDWFLKGSYQGVSSEQIKSGIDDAYEHFINRAFDKIYSESVAKKYLKHLTTVEIDGKPDISFDGFVSEVDENFEDNPSGTIEELLDLFKNGSTIFHALGYPLAYLVSDKIKSYQASGADEATLNEILDGDGVNYFAESDVLKLALGNSNKYWVFSNDVVDLSKVDSSYSPSINKVFLSNEGAKVIGTDSIDVIYGGLGADVLHGQDGNDTLRGGEGDDTLTVNGRGSNTLEGGAGDDTLKVNRSTNYSYQRDVARNASNTLRGGAGNDRLEGSVGAETYVFNRGDGQDTINDYDHNVYSSNAGWGKTDKIVLGEGISKEELGIRREGNHMVLLIGGADSGDSITIENAYTDGRYRIEEVVLADGSSLPTHEVPLYTVEGDNDIQGGGFAETIVVGSGNDKIRSEGGDDVIDSGAGNDTVDAGSGNDVVDGGLGADVLHGQDGNDTLRGGEGDDTLTVNGRGSNTLEGGAGDDTLKVNRSTNYSYQRDVARNASNTLRGGAGNDRLEGSVGAETYVFNRGDGQDTINDYDHNVYSSNAGWGKTDKIVLGEGISKEELGIRREGNHMVLLIGGADSGDSITIENAYTDGRYRIEEVVLADGSSFPTHEVPLYTVEGDNDIQGGGFAETIVVGSGNDKIRSEGGDDVIDSGAGNDTVDAGSGNDVVDGGLGADVLHGQDGNDTLRGGEGDDTLTVNGRGSNTLEGGAGDDTLKVNRSTNYSYQRDVARNASNTLRGGAGNDRLEGSVGAETYVFNRGDGQDTINDYDHNVYSSNAGWGKTDKIVLGEGISKEELGIRREGNHMVLLIGGADSGDSITIENAYTDGRYRIEEVVLADGSSFPTHEVPLYTVEGDNDIQGGGFAETIVVGSGNDKIRSEGGDDVIDSGAGNDTVDAGSGNDVVDGGLGADVLHGQDGNDTLRGGEGDDTLTVNGRGSNTLEGGAGDDTLKVNRSTNYSYQRDVARNASNTLRGGAGNDRLEGSVGAETYVFNRGDGQDTINDYDHNVYSSNAGWGKTDKIVLGEGISKEELGIRREGNHMVLLIGGADSGDSITIENAYTDGRYRIEEVVLADGSSFPTHEVPLYTVEGDNDIQGGGFAETIVVGSGNDKIRSEGGDDVIDSGAGNDTVDAGSGNDVVDGGLGADVLHGQDGNDTLRGGEGDDTLTVNGRGSNTLEGGAGDDTLKVNRSTNYSYQRDVARNASNTLRGGAGNDRLEGSVGAETYVFNRGDGQDTINDYDHNVYSSNAGWGKTDKIVLGEGISKEELGIRREGNHMVLLIGGADSGDSITIENAYTDGRYRIEEVVLADGSSFPTHEVPLHTVEGDNDIQGGGFAETIVVGSGNDKIRSEGGDDVIDSGAGNDTVDAGSGNDVVDGGLGADVLHGQDGNDTLRGGEGDDTLTVNGRGSNTLEGGAGDDTLKVNRSTNYSYQRDVARNASNTLRGGAGNDRLEGSVGAETYVFNRGDGQDTINDYDHNVYSSNAGWGKTDKIVLGEGISKEELGIRREGNHMVLLIGGADSGDSITIENAYTDGRYRIEEVVLADGSSLPTHEVPLYTVEGDNDIQGGGFAETIVVGSGNDKIRSEGGDDVIDSGAGNDTVDAGSGNDVVDGGLGADVLHGQDGNDTLRGGEGDDTLTVNGRGSNTLEGGAGDDTLKVNRSTNYSYQRDVARNASNTLRGGAGNDRLEGSVGAETYVFNRGDGQDTINDYDHNVYSSNAGWGKTDKIVLGEGISKEELGIRREGNHMVLLIGGADSGDSITIENAYTDGRYRIEEVVLADGSSFPTHEVPLYTVEGDNDIQGGGFAETIVVGSGNDKIRSEGGDDVIDSGAGNDTVDAGSGNDVVDGGLGADVLHGQDGNDTLRGGEGDDTLTVNGRGSNTLEGGAGDDTLKVNRSTNYSYQRDVARNASNTLRGGAGNDRLEGSVGAETYVFNRGDGQDTINDYDHNVYSSNAGWGKTDKIVLGEGISKEELGIRREGNHMVLLIGGADSGDSITIENAYTDGRYRIEEVVLADGSSLPTHEVPLYTVEGDNDIQGGGFAETIVVGSGNDKIRSEGGDDVIDSGAGNDTVDAGSGNDVVDGGLGADVLHGQDGNDTLRGGEGDDTLTVNGRGSNTLEGGAGDDTLKVNRSTNYSYQRDVARNASNTLRGGAGNDRLEGSVGAETYVFNRGDGQDTINDYDHNVYSSNAGWGKTDKIVLGEGISKEELGIRREGNHMVLLIGGADSGDSITIENAYTDGRYRIEEVVLADGSSFPTHEVPLYTVEGDNDIQGGGFAETIVVGSGNDKIRSEGGDDVIDSGAGNDTVDAGSGNDVVDGGLGADVLHGQDGNDTLRGGEGDDTLTVNGRGSNTLEGGAGDDTLKVNRSTNYSYQRDVARNASNTLRGGAGNDRLEGSVGAETYVFNRGDGQDTINDYDHNVYSSNAGWGKTDKIVLGEGISKEELGIRREGNHMVLLIGGADSGDSITIENAYTDGRYRIEEVVLADGSSFDPKTLPEYTPEPQEIDGLALIQAMSTFGVSETVTNGLDTPTNNMQEAPLLVAGSDIVR
ncbi:calcium-binding protein [Photobacterium sp. J15]|uniref:calcium-binding protein n=1 Tax=Photobacterium sp. J15 TaxID=265901 RepID=UPI0018DDA1F6|nr:calcium-binding protein [Photobacterium sp. J15]